MEEYLFQVQQNRQVFGILLFVTISLYLYLRSGTLFYKTVCTDCLTKKPIDLTLLPQEFLLEFLAEQQTFLGNRRDSIFGTAARLCDVCFLGKCFIFIAKLYVIVTSPHSLCND